MDTTLRGTGTKPRHNLEIGINYLADSIFCFF